MHGTAMGDAKLPTNLTARSHPVHRWFNFIAGFSPEFVASCIADSPGVGDGYVLDPFAGAGTTLVEAQMCGLSAVGYEPHPFFAEMARAKLATDLTCDDLDSLEQILLGGVAIGTDPWGGVVGDATDVLGKASSREIAGSAGIRPIAVRGN